MSVFDKEFKFSIEKITIEASSRVMKAEYTLELAPTVFLMHTRPLKSTNRWTRFIPYYYNNKYSKPKSKEKRNTRINLSLSLKENHAKNKPRR